VIQNKLSRRLSTGVALMLCAGMVTIGSSVVASAAPQKTPGVTAKLITIGATEPVTGIASPGYSDVSRGANAVFKYINTKGGVNGRKIKYIIKDDCYGTPGFGCTGNPNTVADTRALISAGVFATVGSLGTAPQDSVRTLMKANHVPQLFISSGSRDWNNPGQYPGLFGWQTTYNEEGKIFAKYINATYPKENVCWLGQGDDFGSDGLAGLLAGGVTPVDTALYSVASLVQQGAAAVAPYVARFQKENCTVVVLDTIPGATDAVFASALPLGYTPHWIISSVGADPVTVDAPFAKYPFPDPEIGAVSFSFLPASTATNAWNGWMRKVLLADKVDFPSFTSTTPITGNMAYGAAWAVSFLEALKATGKDVTRASFLKKLTSTTFSQTPALTALRYTSKNHQGLSGGYLVKVTSASATAAVDGQVYKTDSSTSGPIVKVKAVAPVIPAWLK